VQKLLKTIVKQHLSNGRLPPRWVWRYLPLEMQRKLALVSIRGELELLGYDTSKYTDEELEEGIYEISKLAAQVGVTAEQAVDSLKKLAEVLCKVT